MAAASRPRIEAAFQALTTQVQRGKWLRSTNRYGIDASKKVRREVERGTPHNAPDLSEYIAASIPLHCFDGWKYFAAAASRLMHGDWRNALHLGYYAELRAGMSLLASIGIGTFDPYHIALAHNAPRRSGRQGTHDFVGPPSRSGATARTIHSQWGKFVFH